MNILFCFFFVYTALEKTKYKRRGTHFKEKMSIMGWSPFTFYLTIQMFTIQKFSLKYLETSYCYHHNNQGYVFFPIFNRRK